MFVLLLLPLLWSCQVKAEDQSARFYVERVNVFSKYDSAFVLELANSIVPPGRKVGDAEVQYLTSQLESSGLFAHVWTEWADFGKGVRRLTLYCDPTPGREDFVISRVSLVEFPEVAAGDFLRIIADKGIKTGTPLLQFTYQEMNEKIDDSIRESLPPELAKKASGSAWISFKPDGQGKIEIVVSPERPQFPDPAAATK